MPRAASSLIASSAAALALGAAPAAAAPLAPAATDLDPIPTYHHFLSMRELADLFAPSQGDIATITRFPSSFRITVNEMFADRLLIKATGGIPGYEPGAGLDVLDVANFSTAVGRELRGH
ncbi:MAG TPA: protease pro-enzyme activation domain-containing protein [Kofleriaceae bacterium]